MDKNHPLGIDKPTITVSFEPLWKQAEYSAVHERLSLCDTVTIRHQILGVGSEDEGNQDCVFLP